MEESNEEKEVTVAVSESEGCRKTLEIEVSAERVEREKKSIAEHIAKTETLPGFRKGKAPLNIVRTRYAEKIRSEAIKNLIPAAYQEALETSGIMPISDPVFREIITEGDSPLKMKVEVEVRPEFTLEGYKNVEVEDEELTVEDEEIDSVIERLREQQSTLKKVERPVAEGDLVVVDYAPVGEDGKLEEDKFVRNYPIQLGANQVFPQFEEAMIGNSLNETGRVEIAYPDDFKPEHLAGKKVSYEFTIKEIKERKLPELDDSFAAKVNPNYKSVEELREDIKGQILSDKHKEAQKRKQAKAIDIIIEKNPFDVPRSMIERFKMKLYEEDEKNRGGEKLSEEEEENRRKQLDEIFEGVAVNEIKKYFIIEKIAEQEGVEVTDEDAEEEIKRIYESGAGSEEEVRNYFKKGSDNFMRLKDSILERRVFDIIMGN
ncbi:MAG: trigger factor [Candidatus Latescibacteria bacterium 4484_7]|nr:MAG: trigger factor [Candidatus Latescibacteria bacterium 4484_7]